MDFFTQLIQEFKGQQYALSMSEPKRILHQLQIAVSNFTIT